MRSPWRGVFALLATTGALALAPGMSAAQVRELRLRAGPAETVVEVSAARGFPAFPVARLAAVGWRVERTLLGASLAGPRNERVELRDGTPFLRWSGTVLQLAHAPYFEGAELFVPFQFVADLIPGRLPTEFVFHAGASALIWTGAPPSEPARAPPQGGRTEERPPGPQPQPGTGPLRPHPRDPASLRVVVIDAGHGGEDPGAASRSGIREKNVALGVARAMARALADFDDLEVVMIRDGDTHVPLWDRGARATAAKGERYGVFVSIHANSAAVRGSPARGFETYFLSEARTEHERRVAAIENAPLGIDRSAGENTGDLDFILRELKNLDQQHWSSLLAEMVQQEIGRVHPGPDRGVKQAPLAVITNAIMPAVLVEIGYLSHPEEARLLGDPAFQEEAGKALARAVRRFFQRYPPGSGGAGGSAR